MHNIIWILSNLAQHYLQTVRLQNCTSRVNDSAELHLQSAWLGAAESRECLTLHNCPTEYEIAQLHLQTTEDCRATPVECNNLHSCTSRECNTLHNSNVLIAQAQLQFIEKRSVVTPNSSNFRFSDLSDQTIRIFWALGLSPSPTPVSNSPPSFLTYREISSPPFTSHKKGP